MKVSTPRERLIQHGASVPIDPPANPVLTEQWTNRLLRLIEARATSFALAITAVMIFCALGRAQARPLWHDELFTFYLGQLPTAQLTNALHDGVDLNPPLHHLMAGASMRLFGANELAARLPFVIGFAIYCWTLFAFVRKRCSGAAGLLALLMACSGLGYVSSFEARPYPLVLMWCGILFLAWQVAQERNRTLALLCMAIAIAAGVSTHYYFVLLLVPLGIGEVVRGWQNRLLDWPLYAACLAGLTPLALFLPWIRTARSFSGSFWAGTGAGALLDTYPLLLGTGLLPFVMALVWLGVNFGYKEPAAIDRETGQKGLKPHELAAAATLVLLPVFMFALARIATGAFVYRYAIAAIGGMALLLAAVAHAAQRRAVVLTGLLALYTGWLSIQVPATVGLFGRRPSVPAPPVLQKGLDTSLATVVADPIFYLQWQHYASPEERAKVFHPVDLALPGAYRETNTTERNIEQLARWKNLGVVQFKQFLDDHPEFLLFDQGQKEKRWMLKAALDQGFEAKMFAYDAGSFLVRLARPDRGKGLDVRAIQDSGIAEDK